MAAKDESEEFGIGISGAGAPVLQVGETSRSRCTVGRGPVPRRASVIGETSRFRLQTFVQKQIRRRCFSPTGGAHASSVVREHLLPNGSGSGDPDLQG